jgi:hypothetical protein
MTLAVTLFAFLNGMVAGIDLFHSRLVSGCCYATFLNHQSSTSNSIGS